MESTVRIEKEGPVTIVTLDRQEVRNAVDQETAARLHEAFVAFDADDEARVAVFHGAHGHFCAGWDLQYGARLATLGGNAFDGLDFEPDDRQPAGPMGPSRLLLSKPVIAAVSGAAVAGGMELALWCDLRVMEEDAYFGVFCRRFGVPLIDGGTVRLPRLIGMGHAMDLLLTGRKVESAEALQMGLCNRVVPTGQAREGALELARQHRRFSPADAARRSPERLSAMGPAAAAGAAPGMAGRRALRGRGPAGGAALRGRRRPPREVRVRPSAGAPRRTWPPGASRVESAPPCGRSRPGAHHGCRMASTRLRAMATKRFPLRPAHPERNCWGCDKYCPSHDRACGNGSDRTQHPVELFGEEWALLGLDPFDAFPVEPDLPEPAKT